MDGVELEGLLEFPDKGLEVTRCLRERFFNMLREVLMQVRLDEEVVRTNPIVFILLCLPGQKKVGENRGVAG